jgi:Protein of unknown function (DUF742)
VSGPGGNDGTPAGGRYPSGLSDGWARPGMEFAGSGVPNPRDPASHGSSPYRMAEGRGSALVRPYAVTGGRTKPRVQLQIEAMVAASHYEARDLSVLSPECQAILGFCRDWRSVAEVSAVLRMPLGVARVLIADMAGEGLVRIHQIDHAQGRPDINLLERVLSGLRKL